MRPGAGLTALGAPRLGVGLLAGFVVGLAFFGDAGRSGTFFATIFRIVLVFLAASPTGPFFRFPPALTLAFLLFANAPGERPRNPPPAKSAGQGQNSAARFVHGGAVPAVIFVTAHSMDYCFAVTAPSSPAVRYVSSPRT